MSTFYLMTMVPFPSSVTIILATRQHTKTKGNRHIFAYTAMEMSNIYRENLNSRSLLFLKNNSPKESGRTILKF